MAEKCFCHLNGFKVKDADARALILYLTQRIEALEKLHDITPEDPPELPDTPEDPTPDNPDNPTPEIKTCSVRTNSGDYDKELTYTDGMVWGEWFESDYYDSDFSVDTNSYVMLTGRGYLVDNTGKTVVYTDTMKSLQYEVRETESKTTYTVSYSKRKEYNNNGESAFTDPEIVGSQEYEEGETITPLELPTEEGYTASDWEY